MRKNTLSAVLLLLLNAAVVAAGDSTSATVPTPVPAPPEAKSVSTPVSPEPAPPAGESPAPAPVTTTRDEKDATKAEPPSALTGGTTRTTSPGRNLLSGAVTIGDLVILPPGSSGRSPMLVQSGTVQSYLDESGAAVTTRESGPPMFVRDSKGKMTGPLTISPGASSLRSELPKRPNQPRELPRSSFSSMPSRPQTAPPPTISAPRERPTLTTPGGTGRSSFSSMPATPGGGFRRR